jgi:hypothetical protein
VGNNQSPTDTTAAIFGGNESSITVADSVIASAEFCVSGDRFGSRVSTIVAALSI